MLCKVPTAAKDKIIVPLDVPTAQAARELIKAIGGTVGFFKIGNQLFTSAGPDIVQRSARLGFKDLSGPEIPRYTKHGSSRRRVCICVGSRHVDDPFVRRARNVRSRCSGSWDLEHVDSRRHRADEFERRRVIRDRFSRIGAGGSVDCLPNLPKRSGSRVWLPVRRNSAFSASALALTSRW